MRLQYKILALGLANIDHMILIPRSYWLVS